MSAMTGPPRRSDRGFSFIELLAYMAIAALLILAAIPQFNNYRGAARDASTMSDVKNVAVALESWAIEHPGEAFPDIMNDWSHTHSTSNVGILTAQGLALSDGTSIWVRDRTKWTTPASTVFTTPGQAFCVYGYNSSGKRYTSTPTPFFEYHSGNGGMDVSCGSK